MANVFNIPSGPKNLAVLFPELNWDLIVSYNVEVTDGASTVATSPVFKSHCCCPDDKIRLHFLNSLGTFDAVNFLKPHVIHEDASDQFQNALGYPFQKTDTGIERFNIKSNDTYEAKVKCNELDMPWLRELADSPKIFLEWAGTEGQADSYIPVVKIAGKFDKLKNTDEFQYEFIIQFKFSNDYITQRN